MPAVNKEQIAAANLNYRMYPLEFFLDTQKELGLRSIEFCAVAPHFLMDYEGYRDTAPIRAMAEEKGLQIVAFTPECLLTSRAVSRPRRKKTFWREPWIH